MSSSGHLALGTLFGARIRVHWSFLLGAAFFTRMSPDPFLWLGFFLLIFAHELGHAAVAVRAGAQVFEIAVHGFGGHCRASPPRTELGSILVAWGGVLGQLVLALATWVAVHFVDVPHGLEVMFTSVSLQLAIFNLLPIPPLDGARAWDLVPYLARRRVQRRARRRARPSGLVPVARGPHGRALRGIDRVVIDDDEAERLARELARRAVDAAKTPSSH